MGWGGVTSEKSIQREKQRPSFPPLVPNPEAMMNYRDVQGVALSSKYTQQKTCPGFALEYGYSMISDLYRYRYRYNMYGYS
jgi:hypothetical protein